MKKHITTIILIIVLAVGLSMVAYPTFSTWWNQRTQSHAIATYDETVTELTEDQYAEIFAAAQDYNDRLREAGTDAFYNPDLVEGYEETLDITGTGIMGYVTIPRIEVQLPIYHGTSTDVLQVAVGHLEGTSLPVGGSGTHAVIMAHRGLPSSKLFSDLDDLQIGDTFTITVLNEVLTYQVDQITIVLPNEVSDLQIEEGQDYCTLLTCTPYGVNSHRLLVRGVRIETVEEGAEVVASGDAYRVSTLSAALAVAVMLLILLLLLYEIYRLVSYVRGKMKNRKDSE